MCNVRRVKWFFTISDGTEEKFDEATLKLADENSIVVINKIDRHPERSETKPRDLHTILLQRSLGFARDDILFIKKLLAEVLRRKRWRAKL